MSYIYSGLNAGKSNRRRWRNARVPLLASQQQWHASFAIPQRLGLSEFHALINIGAYPPARRTPSELLGG